MKLRTHSRNFVAIALVAAFAAECAAQDVHGSLTGGPARFAIEFAGQEDAGPELMRRAFRAEMEAAGASAPSSAVRISAAFW